MYLEHRRSGANTYLRLMQSVCDTKSGVRKNVLVKNFGNIAKLTPAQLRRIEEKYGDSNSRKQAEHAAAFSEFSDAIGSLHRNSAKEPDLPAFSYAMQILRPLWNGDMDLYQAFSWLDRGSGREFDANAAASYLAMIKLVSPGSILSCYAKRASMLGNPLGGMPLEALYKALGVVGENSGYLMDHVSKAIRRKGKTLTLVFYDCTNFYWETAMDDGEWAGHRLRSYLDGLLVPRGAKPEYVKAWLEETEEGRAFHDKALPLFASGALRMRGDSKEMRTDLPLVSVALSIDADGIPVGFKIYPGNSSEKATMEESVRDLESKYSPSQCMIIADAGLNSAANMEMLAGKGFGFSLAQSPLSLSDADAGELLDRSKYEEILDEEGKPTGVLAMAAPYKRSARAKDESGAWRKIEVDCMILCTWSRKREERDLALIEKKASRAAKAVGEREKLVPAGRGWKQACKTDVPLEKVRASDIRKDLIAKWKRRAGYACQLYRMPSGCAGELSPADIGKLYNRHVRIEDCFRIMKTDFSLRPAFVWTEKHIEGHVALCVLALVMLRLLERKLAEQGTPMCTGRILKSLKGCWLTGIKVGGRWLFERCSAPSHGDGVKLADEAASVLKDRWDILKAVGLNPLPLVSDNKALLKAFRAKSIEMAPEIDELYG